MFHDFTIDSVWKANANTPTGRSGVFTVEIDEPGEDTFCGAVHGHELAGMPGTLIVAEKVDSSSVN